MVSVNWTNDGLTSLARLDAWRVSQGWAPIALELVAAVENYFHRWDPSRQPRFVPGRPVHLDEGPTDLRMVTVPVRSKPFKVYFRYLPAYRVFEVLRVLHPRARHDGGKWQL